MEAQRVVPISGFVPSPSLEKLKLMVDKPSPTLDEHAKREGQVVDYDDSAAAARRKVLLPWGPECIRVLPRQSQRFCGTR